MCLIKDQQKAASKGWPWAQVFVLYVLGSFLVFVVPVAFLTTLGGLAKFFLK